MQTEAGISRLSSLLSLALYLQCRHHSGIFSSNSARRLKKYFQKH